MAELKDVTLLQYIMEASRRLSETRVLDTLLADIVQEVLPLVGAELGYIVLVDRESNKLKVITNLFEQPSQELDDVVSLSILTEVIDSAESIVIANAMLDSRFITAVSVFDLRIRSVMCVPLLAHNEVIGALYVENRTLDGRFRKSDLPLFSLFANQVTISIFNTRLLEKMGQEIETRRQAEAKNLILIDKLERKNRSLEEFAQTISHELRTPLVSASNFLGLLEKNISQGKTNRTKSDFQYIRQAVLHMEVMLNTLQDIISAEQTLMNPRLLSSYMLFNHVLNSYQEQLTHVQVELDRKLATIQIVGDLSQLEKAIACLIDNAIRFTQQQPHPKIMIGIIEDGEEARFFIQDNGIGIDPQYLIRVFNMFERLDKSTGGIGSGLTIAKRIIELHNGRIWIESDGLGHGTTVYFTLPLQ